MQKQADSSSDSQHRIAIYTANNQWILISFAFLYLAALSTEILPALLKAPILSEKQVFIFIFLILLTPFVYIFTRPGIRGKIALKPIMIDEESLRLPLRIGSRRYMRIRFEDIRSLDSRGSGKNAFHILQTKEHTIHLPLSSFKNRDEWQSLIDTILSHIAKLPDGQSRIKLFLKQNRLAHSIFSNKPFFTISILLLITIIFTLQVIYKNFSLHDLAGIGANSSYLLAQGEFFRLLSASLLHAGILHWAINSIALLSIGFLVEGCLGTARTFIIFFLAAITGSFLSALAGAPVSVGSSAGIFGLLAALAVINIRFNQLLPAGVLMPLKWWIILAAVNIILPVLFPIIDQAAHFGGILSGGAITWLMLRREELGYSPKLINKSEKGLIIAVLVLMIIASINSYKYIVNPEARQQANIIVANNFLQQNKLTAAMLEKFAENILAEEIIRPDELKLAKQALEQASQKTAHPRLKTKIIWSTYWLKAGDAQKSVALLLHILQGKNAPSFEKFLVAQISSALKSIPTANVKLIEFNISQQTIKLTEQSKNELLVILADEHGNNFLFLVQATSYQEGSTINLSNLSCLGHPRFLTIKSIYPIQLNSIKDSSNGNFLRDCFQLK